MPAILSASWATNFLYQASGVVQYWFDAEGTFGASNVWGSAVISNNYTGSNLDVPYNHEWASNYILNLNDNYVAFGFDFGAIGGNLSLWAEAIYNGGENGESYLLGYEGGSLGNSNCTYYINDWGVWNLDGTRFDDKIYDGLLFTDTTFYQLMPSVISLDIDHDPGNGEYPYLAGQIILSKVAPLPEPAPIMMLLFGLLCFIVYRKFFSARFKHQFAG